LEGEIYSPFLYNNIFELKYYKNGLSIVYFVSENEYVINIFHFDTIFFKRPRLYLYIMVMTTAQTAHIEEVFRRDRQSLLAFIRKRISDVEEAEDILQDVFYQFVSGYSSIESMDKATSWLFQVARNKIIDRYRKKKHQAWSATEVFTQQEDDTPLMLQDILPDFGGAPDEQYSKNLIWDAIQEALEEMPKDQREVFIWHELEDLSFKEISDRTGVGVNTLLSKKRYAILFLRKKLLELYNEL
jgi:RNA polymerase sigma factor (sigma-70 family)